MGKYIRIFLKSIFFTGYSLAIATMSGEKYAVMGAPRHKHKGQVTVSRIDNNLNNLKQQLDPPKVIKLIFVQKNISTLHKQVKVSPCVKLYSFPFSFLSLRLAHILELRFVWWI